MRIFKINDSLQVVCDSVKTRNGFKHTAQLMLNGRELFEGVKCNYLNRTWERYEYESVLAKLCHKLVGEMTEEEVKQFADMIKNEH